MTQKKVLIIGCSFSNGSYETRFSGKLGDAPTAEHVSSIGWYDHLEVLNGRSMDVYSMPGLGWLAYAHFIKGLRDAGALSQYDLLIIQETFEPRFSILGGNQFMLEFVQSEQDDSRTMDIRHMRYRGSPSAVMTCNPHDGVSFYKDFVSKNKDAYSLPRSIANRVVVDISESAFMQTMLAGAQHLVSDIVKEAKLKVIVISFSDPHMRCADYIDQGPYRLMHSVYPDICLHSRGEYLTDPSNDAEGYGGRLTLNGNRMLGMRFNHLLKKHV